MNEGEGGRERGCKCVREKDRVLDNSKRRRESESERERLRERERESKCM